MASAFRRTDSFRATASKVATSGKRMTQQLASLRVNSATTGYDSMQRGQSQNSLHQLQQQQQQNYRQHSDEQLLLAEDLSKIWQEVSQPPQQQQQQQQQFHQKQQKQSKELLVRLTSCTLCPCRVPVYDEEIMAGWTADDSRMTIDCPFCGGSLRPELTVSCGQEGPFSVVYLSPLVLRKELENLLQAEGENFLATEAFYQSASVPGQAHSLLFWNLLWYLERLKLPHCLCDQLVSRESSASAAFTSVRVQCLWDSQESLSQQGPLPLYRMYLMRKLNQHVSDDLHRLMDSVVACIKENDMNSAVQTVLARRIPDASPAPSPTSPPRRTSRSGGPSLGQRSLYREILFLVLVALGRENINLHAFDQEFDEALSEKLPSKLQEYLTNRDRALPAAMFTRDTFPQLDL